MGDDLRQDEPAMPDDAWGYRETSEEGDVEGHSRRLATERGPDAPDTGAGHDDKDEQDTEGHGVFRSDVNLKQAIVPVRW